MDQRRLPLRGADLVLLAMQALWPGKGVSNNAILVLECDAAIDPERVRCALDGLLRCCPWPVARLRRAFPWGRLYWAVGASAKTATVPVDRLSLVSADRLHCALESELNAAIDPKRDALIRLRIADVEPEVGPSRHFLVLTWFHSLMDPRGAQNLLLQLAGFDGDLAEAPPPGVAAGSVPAYSFRDRGLLARRFLDYLKALTSVRPVSPGSALSAPGPVRFRQESFTESESGPVSGRIRRGICWRLAVVGKAMAELWRRRGLPETPFFVPISVDLRPIGDSTGGFGNRLAFHFARFKPSETADLPRLERTLREQMADAVRDRQIEANAVAMEFLHYRPVSMMLREMPGTSGGETFSFNCADLAAFPDGSRDVFGARIVNAYHVPAVFPRPGIGVFFNRSAGFTNLVISWVEGAVDSSDVDQISRTVKQEMGWRGPV